MQIDYLNLGNSVRNNEREHFLNYGAVTDEDHTQLRSDLINRERKRDIRNHLSIHETLIISLMNATVRNQIRPSDVDRRIMQLQIVRNQKLRIRKFAGTRKNLNPCVHIK